MDSYALVVLPPAARSRAHAFRRRIGNAQELGQSSARWQSAPTDTVARAIQRRSHHERASDVRSQAKVWGRSQDALVTHPLDGLLLLPPYVSILNLYFIPYACLNYKQDRATMGPVRAAPATPAAMGGWARWLAARGSAE
jgi:hypothetical protein